ncbi:MAG: prolipoprotein diacylglyceryl transferase [Chloroflexi bacterium]|nr:MAG: prolipoprotein diacylglyceryl transferase [Chloroflexota bacterium]
MPDGITIFGFKIYFYGILIMLGALAATWVAAYRAEHEYGINGEEAWDILPWALIGGIIGARVWHILTPPASMVEQGITTVYYLTHPLEMLNLRNGGLGIPGAVVGGFIAVWIFVRRRGESIGTWVDIIVPGLALAQAIGRWGNFFNQEVYGSPTSLPWKLFIAPGKRMPEFSETAYYHPLFFYEFIWNMLNAIFLVWIARRLRHVLRRGDLFLIYAMFYSFGRFFLEYLRLDPSPVAGANANQVLMAIIFVGSALGLFLRHRLIQNEPLSMPEQLPAQGAVVSSTQEA